ncbi:hypothetical protein Hrd1104_05275 [Halorhabdus sp. CBA1104]|uniref:DUF5805 domain-containing protein n=1 Tax=Halorhabdus sp. CBA1104 TaxID=1380432 RepID=UPI0012B302FE|nr:DUF5805 domain-containing protein [Halorhabdus sp. CBA1104]QGN06761.1 hypothetical protein Hrd1104_05275 [Halorhabdus sp. CBA1104]
MADETPTSRKSVKTYIPAYQKEAWQDHADDLDMSQSEFVRTMVQAGRRHFSDEDLSEQPASESQSASSASEQIELTEQIRQLLEPHQVLTWEELVEEVIGDLERDLEESLDELQEANVVKYSGRDGGYRLVDT